jgi:subtilisin family serine protease
MTVSMVAPVAGAGMASGEIDSEVMFTDSVADIDAELQNAEGVTTAVIRLEKLDDGLVQAQGADGLKAHAEDTQEVIEAYADQTDGVTILNQFWITNAVVVEVNTDKVDFEEMASLKGVEELHTNFEVQRPDEPSSFGTMSADTNAEDTTYGLDQINADDFWNEYGTMGEGASIAVLDTGVDADHPDIDLSEWAEIDQDSGEPDESAPVRDSDKHGTHTSGTATGGDASGEYIGVAPNAELMHAMVLNGSSGSFASIVGGMEWAVNKDADIISMSLGAGGHYEQFIEPVQNAHDAGTIVIAAAGNDGDGNTGSPGNIYDTISVGATNSNEDVTDFSGGERVDTQAEYGDAAPSYWPDEYVVPNVVAPGKAVKSSVPGGNYEKFPGTSMATPHVAGAVALLESATDRDLTIEEIDEALKQTARKPSDAPAEPDTRYGHGIIDVVAAMEHLSENETSAALSLSNAEATTDDSTVTVELSASGDDIAGYEAMITFDPSVVQVESISGVDMADPQANIDNQNGVFKIAQAQDSGMTDPVLAEITFSIEADGEAATALEFNAAESDLNDVNGNMLDADLTPGAIDITKDEPTGEKGDVDGDGDVTSADATLAQRHIAGDNVDINEDLADMDGDGSIDTGDVIEILNKVVDFEAA